MPYRTERGVTVYFDHDTPSEYASGADEDRAAYNGAQDAAFAAVETLYGLIDELCDPPTDIIAASEAMRAMTAKLNEMVADAQRLLGRAA